MLAANTPTPCVIIRVEKNIRYLTISLLDNGPGIPQEIVDDLFTPFFSTKEHGMGIGLAVCRSIIEAHGGRIGMKPNQPCGSIFYFTLPIHQEIAG